MLIVPLGHVVWNIKLKISRREVGIYGLSSNCFLADNTLGLESMNAFKGMRSPKGSLCRESREYKPKPGAYSLREDK